VLEDYRHQHRHQTHNLHCSVQYEYRALYGTDTGIRNVEMFFDKGPPLHNTIEIWPFLLGSGWYAIGVESASFLLSFECQVPG